jgi:oligopeptide transport system substrate-binding protein
MVRWRSLLFPGLSIALLVGPAAPSAPAAADDEQVLRIGNGAEPATLDPQVADGMPDRQILYDLSEGLVTVGKSGEVVPGQAERWSVSADGLTYRFTLRTGLEWSDGTPVTAEDFAWSWRRAVAPPTGSKHAALYAPIRNAEAIASGAQPDPQALGVRTVDRRTFEVTLKAPTGYFLKLIGHSAFMPAYRPAVERYGAQASRPGNLVTNGAFMLAEWTPQSRIVAIRNPHYWDAANVAPARIEYLPITDQAEELRRYRAGGLDVTNEVPADQLELIRKEMPAELRIAPILAICYLGFDLTQPPFHEAPKLRNAPKLREAINLAIDREALVGKIAKTGEQPAYGWVPPGIAGYRPQSFPWKDWSVPARVARARELFREAGFDLDRPLTVELSYETGENRKRIMVAVAVMLRQVLGMNVVPENQEPETFAEMHRQKKLTQMFSGSWIADYADANSFAELLRSNSELDDPGYASADYDRLVQTAAVTVDPERRAALLEEAERLVLRDLPIVPLLTYTRKRLVKPDVLGFDINILGFAYAKHVRIAGR